MKDTERGGNQDDKDNHAWLQWKMGQVITKIAEADSKVEIVAGVDQFQGVQNPYPVFSSMEACDAEADVVIDFPMRQQWTDFWTIV